MATEKKTAVEADKSDWKPVTLPRVPGHNAKQQKFVSVNFKNYLIKTGETVMVPPEVYEALMNAQLAESEAYAYSEDKQLKPED